MRVIACAGAGKTTFIINYIKENNIPDEDFIVFTFSRCSCNDFSARMGNAANNIRTIHSFAYQLAPEDVISVRTVILKAIEKIKLQNLTFNFKYIFVDESQDLAPEQYEFIMLVAERCGLSLGGNFIIQNSNTNKVITPKFVPKPAKVIMVGDINQCIYKFQNSDEKFLRHHPGEQIELAINYRSTDQIVEFCNYLKPYPLEKGLPQTIYPLEKGLPQTIYPLSVKQSLTETERKEPLPVKQSSTETEKQSLTTSGFETKGTGKQGPPVNITVIKRNELNKKIIALLDKHKDLGLHNIAIIGPVRKFGNGKNLGIYTVEGMLRKHNVKYQSYYTDFEYDTKDIIIKENYLNLLTIHNSKGLQFKCVILINFHYNAFGRNPTEITYEHFKHMFYVGCTRAEQILEIVVDKKKYIFPMFNDIPERLYTKNEEIKKLPKLKFEKENDKLHYNVTELSKDLDIKTYYEIEKLISFEVEEEFMWEEQPIYLEHPDIAGIFLEKVFNLSFNKQKTKLDYVQIYKDVVRSVSINQEKPFLLDEPYQKTIYDLIYYIRKIKEIKIDGNITLQKYIEMGKICGVPDIITEDGRVIDLKFVTNPQYNVMQIFIYCVMLDLECGELWNFRGKKYKYKFDKSKFDDVKKLLSENLI